MLGQQTCEDQLLVASRKAVARDLACNVSSLKFTVSYSFDFEAKICVSFFALF